MRGVGVVAEIHRASQRAAVLREHLETFTVERCFRRQRMRHVEQDDFFDRGGLVASVRDVRPAHVAVPRPDETDRVADGGIIREHDAGGSALERLGRQKAGCQQPPCEQPRADADKRR